MVWTHYFSCFGNKSSQGKENNYKKDDSYSRTKTRQEMSNINSYHRNPQHSFHDHDGQNDVSSMRNQDCRQTSCGENDCNPSFNHNCPSNNRNCQHVLSGRKCPKSSSNRKRRRSSNNRNDPDLSRGRGRDLKHSSRDGNYSNLFGNRDRESSSNNRHHQGFGYYQDFSTNNRITKGSDDIRMAHRIRLNHVPSISTSDYDEYFSCIEE